MLTATVLILGVGDRQVPDLGGRVADVARFDVWGTSARAWFEQQLAGAVVGWRCVIVGPHVEASAAEAVARGAGAVSEEITVVITERTARRVYCPVCGSSTSGSEPRIRCTGCGTTLAVGEHFSARLAAYLGAP